VRGLTFGVFIYERMRKQPEYEGALLVANSGAPPVLVAFGDYDAVRLREFAAGYGGALVERWQLFGEASLLEAAE